MKEECETISQPKNGYGVKVEMNQKTGRKPDGERLYTAAIDGDKVNTQFNAA